MTFTEAAIEVLRREGKPLHFKKIAEIAIRENLLDHVGKIPEETMADQLTAHCRLPRTERRVAPVQQGTFALVEWGLEEDPAGLEGLIEVPPALDLLYRSRERHPIPSRDLARGTGRGGDGGRPRRREEEERRGRRFPPPAEVAYEILAGAGRPLALFEIAAQGAERLLMPDAFVRDAASLQAALAEDNRRRESTGRKPLFQLEGETVTLVAQPEPGERAIPAAAPRMPSSVADLRRTALAALRRRLRDCDGPTIEHVAGKLLEKLGFREVKVAKRGREHVVYTGKRRMGLSDVRHGIRIVRSGADAGRREVADLRRDLAHYGAQIGVVITAGDAAREARAEASAAGQLPLVLLCGEGFAEALADAGVGSVPVVVPDVDEAFFRSAAEAAEREEAARRARREDRERREPRREPRPATERGGEPRERAEEVAPSEEPPRAPEIVEVPATLEEEPGPGDAEADAQLEGDEEGPEEAEGASSPEGDAAGAEGGAEGGAAGERRRRRRRRRRRGGRGRGREGTVAGPGAPGQAADAAAPDASGAAAAPAPAPDERPPAPEERPSAPDGPGGGDGGASS